MIKWNDIIIHKPINESSLRKQKLILVCENGETPEPAWILKTGEIVDADNNNITESVRWWAEWDQVDKPL